MRQNTTWSRILPCLALALAACDDGAESSSGDPLDASAALPDGSLIREGAPAHDGIYGFAHGCYAVEGYEGEAPQILGATDGGFSFGAEGEALIRMHPSDLGSYLLYDGDRRYVVAEGDQLTGPTALESEITRSEDGFKSPAEWTVEISSRDPERFQLQHKATGRYLGLAGLTDEASAAVIAFLPREGCAEHPEMTVDAVGDPAVRSWPDGDLYGIAEVHSHMFTNMGFAGSGMFHGAPFHPLGVAHALGGCDETHGEDGRRDMVGLFFDNSAHNLDVASLLPILTSGESEDFNHFTDGFPTFTEWPNAWKRSTHQTMYYRWLERAWRGGLRLVVQHVTGNSVLCELGIGVGTQIPLYSCNDMVTADRSIESVRQLERYIDAQAGGPGQGWLRVVTSPAEAREVIAEGKLAIILGIEISNLFDCFLTPPEGLDRCTIEDVRAALDRYHDLGVRVLFPVHKFDNGFGPGDGMDGAIELGNFINTGHYTSKTEECPLGMQGFDHGSLTFSDLNQPREVFDAPPVVDMSHFADDPVAALRPYLGALLSGPAEGNFCQTATLTELGEQLLHEMMIRGMIPDIAHLPQRSLARTLEILQEMDYPALSTHHNTHGGVLMGLGGLTQVDIKGCADPDQPKSLSGEIRERAEARAAAGAHPGTALGFDLNGFAGARRPRFGDDTRCQQPQANPVTYPFQSYDGAVEFQQPHLGERTVDFNTEGFVHIGMLPELIEDARRDGATDEDLAPLFRSAESVVRLWERAETRAEALSESTE